VPSAKSLLPRRKRASVPALQGKPALRTLTVRGPHRVLRGDLNAVGLPGTVLAPERGLGLPAVAFGHGWMTGTRRYRGLLEHLASWGIVVIAPNTERGVVPSHLELACDLNAALDVATGIRLGVGEISVDPNRLGLVGHGMGAGAAVIAAARRSVAALAALYPAPTSPAAESLASSVTAPALVVAGSADIDEHTCNARALAAALGGNVHLRLVRKASQTGLVEGRQLMAFFDVGGRERATVTTTRALLTGYLLWTLTGDLRFRSFVDDEVAALPHTTVLDRYAEPEPEQPPSRLAVARALIKR
jgi:dienelactone hydrolase